MRSPIGPVAHPALGSLAGLLLATALASCADDDTLDDRDGAFTGPKADGLCVTEGSTEAAGMLAFVNDPATTVALLDAPTTGGGVGLDRRAAEGIVAVRPIADLAALDAVPFVGLGSCIALRDFACAAGRCEDSCQAGAFTAPPRRTAFDAGCASALVIAAAGDVVDARDVDVDVADRCDQLSPAERVAFDLAAHEFDVPPADLDNEFSLTARILGGGVTVVRIDDLNGGLFWYLLLEGAEPRMRWGSDGLSSGVDFYCPGGAAADEPDEFCTEAMARAACTEAERTTRTASGTIADLGASRDPMVAGGARGYAELTGAAEPSAVSLELAVCPFDQSARVSATGAAGARTVVIGEALSSIWLIAGGPAADDLDLECGQLVEL